MPANFWDRTLAHLVQMHVPLRVGQRAAGGLEVLLERADQVPTGRPVVRPLDPGSNHELHSRVPEFVDRYDRLRVLEHARVSGEHVQTRANRGAQIIIVSHTDRQIDAPRVADGLVDDRLTEDLRVGDSDLDVVTRRQQTRENADLLHGARGSAHIYVIADVERTECEQHHTGGEVREGVLERQRDRAKSLVADDSQPKLL